MSGLTCEAEEYLERLDKALWPLTLKDRQVILLEMRSHFEERLEQGPLYLLSTLEHMGPVDDVARAFVEAAGGRWHSRAANENSQLPDRHRSPVVIELSLYASVLKTFQASRNGLWTACAVLVSGLTATNFVAGVNKLTDGAESLPIWFVLLMRSLLVIGAMVAIYRALLNDDDNQWTVDTATLRFACAVIGMAISSGGILYAAKSLLALALSAVLPPTSIVQVALVLGVVATTAMLFLRLQPWAVGLAVGTQISLKSSWTGTSRHNKRLIVGWSTLVAPLVLIHSALAISPRLIGLDAFFRFGLSVCLLDAVVSALIVLMITLLNAVAFRWVIGEDIPNASPFSTRKVSQEELFRQLPQFRERLEAQSHRN